MFSPVMFFILLMGDSDWALQRLRRRRPGNDAWLTLSINKQRGRVGRA
jgi:hypothetical protein